MAAIRLRIPKQNPDYIGSVPETSKALKKWCDSLSLANQRESIVQLNTMLGRMNRIPIKPETRYQLLMQLHPVVAELTNISKKPYLSSRLPLLPKTAQSAEEQRKLLTAMADGFKIISAERLQASDTLAGNIHLTENTLYMAIHYLGLIVLDHYLIYAEQPSAIWGELNQLYALAEAKNLQTQTIDVADKHEPPSIQENYQRILLLALTNPYHLMQGEAARLFTRLTGWSNYARLISGPYQPGKSGKFVVDLAASAPPKYSSRASHTNPPKVARIIDVSRLLDHLEHMISQQSTSKVTIAERIEQGMYRRVSRVWGARSERLSPRVASDVNAEIVFGLRHCHQLMSDNAPFYPEQTEAALLKGDAIKDQSDDMVLLPYGNDTWDSNQYRQGNTKHTSQTRTSNFDTQSDHRDIWKKVYSTSAKAEHYLNESKSPASVPEYTISIGKQGTESNGGIDLSCDPELGITLRVGDVVGFRTPVPGAEDVWEIGSITWLRIINDGTVYIGIKRIAGDALPVASRGLVGVGEGSEYYRSLIVPRLDPAENPTSIITPAAVYDVDSRIFINTGEKVLHVRLTQMVDTTNSYSHFRFERLH
ncbi:MAG: hypothetical protein COC05_02595 [Gammaproteobacteria bacterium]|nr:MAG: hypothetical protein COC05_02595 [Gammaproteobacteria bacterium]